jgi:hypothetical protein
VSDTHGPIDIVVLEFPGEHDLAAPAAALLDLVDSGTVRLYDLVAVRKVDGRIEVVELENLGDDLYVLSGARSGLLDDDDLAAAGEVLQPGATAVVIMYENLWAIPFVGAALDAGGTMIASQRIPAEDVIATLDALEADG